MTGSNTLYIVMPAYNEATNIEEVVKSWYEVLKLASSNSKIVVAPSGSCDNTIDILKKLQEQFKNLEILETTNKYHGPKVISLYKYAIAKGADYIFQTDSDGQTLPDDFYDFWNLKDKYVAIFGDRKERKDGNVRKFVERFLCILLFSIYGIHIADANAPFRLFKAETLNKYIDILDDDYNIPNIALTIFYTYNKENILFKTVSFGKRKGGTNSVDIIKIFKIGFSAIPDFFRFRRMLKMKGIQ